MRRIVRMTGMLTAIVLFASLFSYAAFSESTGSDSKNDIILYVGSPIAFVNGTRTMIDPDDIEVTPTIISNVEMVPVRFIAESLGGSVEWDRKSLTASIILDGKRYRFTQGSDTMSQGARKYSLGAVVQAYKGRTFVPLDKFAELIGKKAFYDRGLIIISDEEKSSDTVIDKAMVDEWISRLSYLPTVGSYDKLMSLLEDVRRGADKAAVQSTAGAEDAMKAAAPSVSGLTAADTNASAVPEHSATNVQVQGVDEGDIVKTDGNFIYQVNKSRIVITRADSPDKMSVQSIVDFAGKNIEPQELYIQDGKMIVIGSSRAYFPIYKYDGGIKKEIYPSERFFQNSVKVLIYDVSDREKVKQLREVEIEGRYVSSRKIGPSLYLVANDEMEYYRVHNDGGNITPSYRDSNGKDEYVSLGFESIRYFPGAVYSNYMIVACIDVDAQEPANVCAYLGAGQNIYVSPENLYVAVANHSGNYIAGVRESNTLLYKFGLKDSRTTYLCKGEVPGSILNQFSMDEYGGSFRIATTKGSTFRTGANISKNCLYILDSMLSITGRIEDMAPGERIYSVRFMGDRAYVVTFKTVDPLFVLDLQDPQKPAVLGALKIPGYSDYLHPYDENHIIGFGKDTVEMKGQAYYKGMKIALFDVTDVSKPVQKFSEIIGDRGTDSELLTNHRALLFLKEKNLLAFPVTLMETGDSDKAGVNSLQYGKFTFQGAYVYGLDLKNGFSLKGRITHLTAEDYLKAGNSWYDSDKNVRRIIYIGGNLFTLSNRMIKANSMSDLKETGSIDIP